jgi:hypothetical protein
VAGGLLENHIFSGEQVLPTKKNGMAMGSSLLPITSNIFIEHFEQLALDSTQHKPTLWLWYTDDTFVVWPHGPQQLQNFLSQINSLRPSIQFNREVESQSAIPFLNFLVIRKEITLDTHTLQETHPHWWISQLQI